MTSIHTLALESLVVAVFFVILGAVVHSIFMKIYAKEAMMNHTLLGIQAGITAAAFHIISELSSVNTWYCRQKK